MDESSITRLRGRLQAIKGRWAVVAKGSGVPVSTVRKIAQGYTRDPRIATVDNLTRYLDAHSSPSVTPSEGSSAS